jgi:hypothetical protein
MGNEGVAGTVGKQLQMVRRVSCREAVSSIQLLNANNREPVGFQKDRHTISEFLYLNRADTGSVAVLRHTIVSI